MTLEKFPARRQQPVSALGFDFGSQRIGVAYGQSLTGSCQSVTVLKARDGIPDWDSLAKLIEQWQPDLFVVGLPYNLDGSDSELLKRAQKFGQRLNGRYHKPSYGMDERLSSVAAAEELREENRQGVGRKNLAKPVLDDRAARIILEDWLREYRRLADASTD